MTNTACQNQRKGQDCISRNARRLCDVCSDLLTDSEHREREITFLAAELTRKASRTLASMKPKPRRCIKRTTTRDDRTCAERGATAPCAYCVSRMSEAELLAHAAKVVDDRERSRQYWEEYSEAQEYADELKAAGVTGIDWNIEGCNRHAEGDLDVEHARIVLALFLLGTPCFIHDQPPLTFSEVKESAA